MECDLESDTMTTNVALACDNHKCGIFFNDRPDMCSFTYFTSQPNPTVIRTFTY